MHEMSVAQSILEMAGEEAARNGCTRVVRVRVDYGPLSGIMPEALEFGFSALARGTPHEGARLELRLLPLRLRCPFCGAEFDARGKDDVYAPCPECGEALAHTVISGHELLLARLEAE